MTTGAQVTFPSNINIEVLLITYQAMSIEGGHDTFRAVYLQFDDQNAEPVAM